MISQKYFTHRYSDTGKDSLNESFLSEGMYADDEFTFIVIGEDYDFTDEIEAISEGWFSSKFKNLKKSMSKFLNKRMVDKAKDWANKAGTAIDNFANKVDNKLTSMNKDAAKKVKVCQFVKDALGETEEMTLAIMKAVEDAQNIKFIKSNDKLTINVGDDGMRALRGIKIKIGNNLKALKDRMIYKVNGKQVRFDHFTGNILIKN